MRRMRFGITQCPLKNSSLFDFQVSFLCSEEAVLCRNVLLSTSHNVRTFNMIIYQDPLAKVSANTLTLCLLGSFSLYFLHNYLGEFVSL